MSISPIFKAWRVFRHEGRAKEAEVAYLYPSSGGGEPILRYLLTFRAANRKVAVAKKQFFNEQGLLVDSSEGFSVPKEIFNPMARMARAIFSERRKP